MAVRTENCRNLDADYLRLQVAIEAFAYWRLRLDGDEERTVVKDKAAWKRWVKGLRPSLLEHASPGLEESLYNKVMGVYRLASGRVVPSAFQACGLDITEEMGRELEARNVVVHQGMMAPDDCQNEPSGEVRVAMLRAMLVALVAKTARYSGAINGWKVGSAGYPVEPDSWWTVDDADRMLAKSVCFVEQP